MEVQQGNSQQISGKTIIILLFYIVYYFYSNKNSIYKKNKN